MIDLTPEHLFNLAPRDLTGVAAELGRRVEEKAAHFAAPRDRALAFEFLGWRGPLGRVFVYGAGAHSTYLVPALEDAPGTRVVGLVDRNWKAIGSFQGYEVIGPEQLPARSFDHVLVASEVSEAEMVENLLALGLEPDRILRVYTHPDYVSRALDLEFRALAPRLPERARCVILEGTPGGLFYSSELLRHLPPEETVVISYPHPYSQNLYYRSCDARHSLGLVSALLRRLRPEVVYLRTQFTTHFLAHLARTTLPDARIVHEFHDFALVTPSDALVSQVCGSERELETVRLAELDSLAHSDVVLSKYGGPAIDHLMAITGARHIGVFPYLRPREATPVLPDGGPIRVVYAGQLYPPGQPPLLKTEWNYLPLFLRLADSGRFAVAAYNSVHRLPSEDATFRAFHEAASTHPGFSYHRALGYRPTVERMAGFHWGFLYNDAPRLDNLSRQVAIAARLTGYLNAGLPVVVDAHHLLMAELVQRFGAGFVHPLDDPEGLVPALLSAHEHHADYRQGAWRLHAHLLESNRRALQEVWG